MRTEEYKSSICRRWSSRTFSTAAITLLNCRSLAEFISLNRLFSEGSGLKDIADSPYISQNLADRKPHLESYQFR